MPAAGWPHDLAGDPTTDVRTSSSSPLAPEPVVDERLADAAAVPTPRRPHPSALHLRRPAALRRHAARSLGRGVVVAVGDGTSLTLLLTAAWIALAAAPAAQGSMTGARTSATLLLSLATAHAPLLLGVFLGALLAAGAYRRRSSEYAIGALVRGSVLGTLLALAPAVTAVDAPFLLGAVVVIALSVVAVLLVGRQASALFLRRVWPGRRGAAPAVFVGSRADYRAVRSSAMAARGDYRILGWVSPSSRQPPGALGGLRSLGTLIHEQDIETVVVGGYLRDERLRHVREICLAAGCELLYPMRAVRLGGVRPRLVWLHDQPYFDLGAPTLRARALLVKRIVDVLGALVGLVLLAPLMGAIAVAVKLDSDGPVLFGQNRAGMGGRRFRMLKFRTMRRGADEEKEQLAHLNLTGDPRLFKIEDDPRVTRLGRFLRRWSLDELPQLWNVLAGEMSLVGPRPFFERDLISYEDHHFHRLGAQPGITGLWQVSGRSAIVDFEEVVRLDREYIETWSLWLDLWIVLRTVPAVLSRTGAY